MRRIRGRVNAATYNETWIGLLHFISSASSAHIITRQKTSLNGFATQWVARGYIMNFNVQIQTTLSAIQVKTN